MSQKIINIPGVGEVKLQKRKGAKSIRLAVAPGGQARIIMPSWTPYKVAESFIYTKLEWIRAQQKLAPNHKFIVGERIGKNHRLVFNFDNHQKVASRVTTTQIITKIPIGLESDNLIVQKSIRLAAVRALKQEAEILLPQRLNKLADQHGFIFTTLSIKNLKRRWGSCNHRKEITLNCFLMQLPWDLIDYVILHELVHTRIMAHGSNFWIELAKYVKELPTKRKIMKTHQPELSPQD